MQLLLKREVHPSRTIGKLYEVVNGKNIFLMYTLERPVGSNRTKLDAIPYGIYEIQMTLSASFSGMKAYKALGGLVPLLMNVVDRSGIRIHIANLVQELQGCIAVGMKRTAYGAILNSKDAYTLLHAKLLKAWEAKEPIKITIE
ncbi:DUF5675 family protein [Emticicia fontis]